MPFYEYECSSCKFYVEALQKVTDDPLKKCPSCGKDTLQRLISAPVFRLKGGGWYETDFKSDKENKRNLVDSGAGDKEPAAKPEADDKKIKVRASKALKKVVAKKSVTRPGSKKAAGKTAATRAAGKKAGKQPARKARAARKPVRKQAPARRSVKPAVGRLRNKVARKK